MPKTTIRNLVPLLVSAIIVMVPLLSAPPALQAASYRQESSEQEQPAGDASQTPETDQPSDSTSDNQPGNGETAETDAPVFNLPFDWQGEASVAADAIDTVAPPLAALQLNGSFNVAYVPADTGNVLRILSTSVGRRNLLLGWRLNAESQDPALPRDTIVRLFVEARLYSPPGGANLTIRTRQENLWTSSSTNLSEIAWTPYTVTHHIDPAAGALIAGIDWSPTIDNAWLELRNLRVEFAPAGVTMDTLSPTDTPTPPPTATPVPPTPTPTATATLTPTLFVVTSTPTPEDVFAAATHVAMITEWARVLGTATPTPPNMVTATFTPTPTPTLTPIIITNTPTPGNAATATYDAQLAAAVALATGTPTPFPEGAIVQVATETPTPKPKPTTAPRPTRTPTPIFRFLADLNPTAEPTPTRPMPDELIGKIVFLSDYLSGNVRRPNAYLIDPDGNNPAVMTSLHFHQRAEDRDAYSPDNRYFVYARREHGAGNAGNYQIFYDDLFYSSFQHQLTYFGVGVAWAPVWSPRWDYVALVSSESANDEIWLVQRDGWPAQQLTKNDWEWDHHPSFSPDGSQLAFMSNRITGTRQVWIMDVSGDNPRQLTFLPGAEAWNPVWIKYKD